MPANARATGGADAVDANDGDAGVGAVTADGHQVGQRRDLVEQFGEFGRLGRVVERGDEFDRVTERREVLAQLLASAASSMGMTSRGVGQVGRGRV